MLTQGRSPYSSASSDVTCRWAPFVAVASGARPRWMAPIGRRKPSASTRHFAGQRISIRMTTNVAQANGGYPIVSRYWEVVPVERLNRSRMRRQIGNRKCRSNRCIGSVARLRRYRCMTGSSNHLTAEWVCVAPTNWSWCRTSLLSHLAATASVLPYRDELKATHRMVTGAPRDCGLLSPLDPLSEQLGLEYMIVVERCTGDHQFLCEPPKWRHDVRYVWVVIAYGDLPSVFGDTVRVRNCFWDLPLGDGVRRCLVHRDTGYRFEMSRDELPSDGVVAYRSGIGIQSAGIVGCARSDRYPHCSHMYRVGRHHPRTSYRVYIGVLASHFKARVRDPTIVKLYLTRRDPAKRSAAMLMTSCARPLEPYANRYLHSKQQAPLRAAARFVECLTGSRKNSQHGQHKLGRNGNRVQWSNANYGPYQLRLSLGVRSTCSIEDQVQTPSPLPSQPQQVRRRRLWRKNATSHESCFYVDGVAQPANTRFGNGYCSRGSLVPIRRK